MNRQVDGKSTTHSNQPDSLPGRENRTAVVTGSSSGIGQSTAIRLAAGYSNGEPWKHIIVHGHSNPDGARRTAELVRRAGAEATVLISDLGDSKQRSELVRRCFESADQAGCPIGTWANVAGVDVLTGTAANWSFQQKLDRLFEIDVSATIQISRDVASRLIHSPSDHPASMAFIGWDQANDGMEGDAGQMFGPIKAAVTAFALSLAQELAPRVRVNVIAPGWIRTAWGETAQGYWDDRACEQSLLNRWGTPNDVANAIAFACDPRNSFFNGQVINVNGGWNRRFVAGVAEDSR